MEEANGGLSQEVKLLHDHVCEGLGDPKRVLILYLLADHSRNVSELTEALNIPQSTTSHHLKVLRNKGLVKAERNGTSVYYSLTDHRIITALDIMREMLADILSQKASVMGATGAC